jgi:hypothetical protein
MGRIGLLRRRAARGRGIKMLTKQQIMDRTPVGLRPLDALEDAIKYVQQAADLLEDAGVNFNYVEDEEMFNTMQQLSAALIIKMKRRFPDMI